MNDVQIFENDKFGKVRTVEMNGEAWFVGKDIAEALGYSDVNKAVAMHVSDEDKKLNDKTSLSFGQRGTTLINESGLYSLIFGSKLDSAKEFKHWVTSEVLPSIRKTGGYVAPVKSSIELNILEEQNKINKANIYLKLSEKYKDNKTYAQILDAYATKAVEGEFVLPLPKMKQHGKPAEEIGKILGISAQMVGKLAKKYGLKTDEYGDWRLTKSRYSSKEVENFFYYDNAIDKFRECIEMEAKGKESA